MNDIIPTQGPIDIVANNAAHTQTGTIEEAFLDDALRLFQINLFGPLNFYYAVLH